jgi:hypothetical protein
MFLALALAGCSSAQDSAIDWIGADASSGDSDSKTDVGGADAGSGAEGAPAYEAGREAAGPTGTDANADAPEGPDGGAAGDDGGPVGDDGGPVGQYDGGFVGPVVPPDCPGDPTQGWTEYTDTFTVQHPYNLMVSDRFSFQNGIYTFWIFPNDLPLAPGNTTAPRTEARWSDMTNNPHMWTGDVMFESPGTHTALFQVHQTATAPGGPGAGPVYLRVDMGDLHELNGQPVVSGIYDKWFNLKVAFDPATADATIWINNCQKLTLIDSRPGIPPYYFKNGVYTCLAPICRDHYKNIRLYQK